jgi:hypothetical protein
LRELFAAYVETKQEHNVLDYDDLLLYWAQAVSDPLLADDIGGRWDHVLVDEYQDTNRLQSSILLALKPGGRGLTEGSPLIDRLFQQHRSSATGTSKLQVRSLPLRPESDDPSSKCGLSRRATNRLMHCNMSTNRKISSRWSL